MNFLIHLLIIAVGISVLALFAAAPEMAICLVVMLVCGYLGSSMGFFGTLGGLLFGILPGIVLALTVEVIKELLRKEPKKTKRTRRKP